jgi:anti-anti-sigma factor
MESKLHTDPVARERTIAGYLARTLTKAASEEFEAHYLSCDDCFEEIRAAELLIPALRQPAIESVQSGDITVIRFTGSAQLTVASSELSELIRIIDERSETKVLIDLQKVSRIDSTGLGLLMQCYTHAIRNSGVLKLFQPTPPVKRVLSLTKIDSVVPTFEDEAAALQSFE